MEKNSNMIKFEKVMEDKKGFRKWNFIPDENGPLEQSGYEDVYDLLEQYTYERYMEGVPENHRGYQEDDTENQIKLQDEIIKIYQDKSIFPITYYTQNGILNEIKKCLDYEIEFEGDTVSGGNGVGTGLCNFLFPNLFDVVSSKDLTKSKENGETGINKFHNEDFLRRVIRVAIQYGGSTPQPSAIKSSIGLVGSLPTNFKPMIAKAIYNKFCEEGDTIWDMSCGYGGRMLGCLSSKKSLHYIGTEPNTETMSHLKELGEYIEKVTGRKNSYELHCTGSEEFCLGDNVIDFAFTSPPYFDLEIYSSEETQSINKFPTLESWLEGFVRGTIKNIYKMLKPGKFYAVNIADFTLPEGIKVAFVDEWSRISEEEGFERMPNIYMGIAPRAGSLEAKMGEAKKEHILVFKSNKGFFDF